MPNLSASNRVQVAYRLEGVYPTNYGVAQPGAGTLLNYTGESLSFDLKTETSKAIRADRQTTDMTTVGASAQGGIQFEHVYKDLDPLVEALMQGTFAAYGTAGVSAAIATMTLASGSVTAGAAPAGVDAFTGLQKGQWFAILPPAGATAAVKAYFAQRAFRVSPTVAPTGTVITLDASTPINTTIAGTSLANARISSSVLTNGVTMRSFNIEVQHTDINRFRLYTGMVPSKMDLKLSAGALVTRSMDFMGKAMTLNNSAALTSLTDAQTYTVADAVRGVVDVFEGGATLSTTTYIKSADISFDNTLRAQEAVGVFGNAGVAAGTIKCTGKLEMYFADEVHYKKFLENSVSSLSIPVLDPEGNGYVYHLPRIKYSAAKVNAGGLDQDNMLSMDFTALMDTNATSATFQKTMAIYRVGV